MCFGVGVSERGQLHLGMTGCSGYNPVLCTQEFMLLKGSHTQKSTVKFPKEKKNLSPKTGCSCMLTELGSMNARSNGIASINEAPGVRRLWCGGGESKLEIASLKCEAVTRCRQVSRGSG